MPIAAQNAYSRIKMRIDADHTNCNVPTLARAIVPQFIDGGQPIGNHAAPPLYLE
jgi:hypothetical protein